MRAIRRAREAAGQAFVTAQRQRRRLDEWKWRTLPRSVGGPCEVVESFDYWAYLRELVESVSATLDANGIEHLVLDDDELPRPVIAVRSDRAAELLRLVARVGAARSWWISSVRGGVVGRGRSSARPGPIIGGSGLVLSRDLRAPSGLSLVSAGQGLLIEFWRESKDAAPSPGGGEYPAGTLHAPRRNGVLDYASAALWSAVQANGHRLPATRPHLLRMTEPVDLVYTWTDGRDPGWQERRNRAWEARDEAGPLSPDAAGAARFDTNDELRYSLRSVAMFANWVRHIWIVTDRQVPAWLVPDERLTVVDHREIFADPSVLPVFNSHAIESQLHHIPGLADHYLYLNDDMLFGAPVRPEAFFHGNGISKYFPSTALLDIDGHLPEDLSVVAAAKNDRDLLEDELGRTVTAKLRHTPQPQQRQVIAGFEAAHPEVFDAVMRSSFRHSTDYSLPSMLAQYYAHATARAVPARIAYGYLDLASAAPEVTLERWLSARDRACLCINDAGDGEPAAHPRTLAALRDFFDSYFPVPSPWEAPDKLCR